MFDAARAAGLPMLGGVDIFVPSASGVVRAHYWAAGWPARDPHDQPESSRCHNCGLTAKKQMLRPS